PRVDVLHVQHPYASYGFGMSLLELPFVALQHWLAPSHQTLVALVNPIVLALCGALLVLIGQCLGWRRNVCIVTALGAGVLTPALWQSTDGFSEPAVTLGMLLALYGLVTSRAAFIGSGCALAIICRPDSIVLVAPIVLISAALTMRLTKRTIVVI